MHVCHVIHVKVRVLEREACLLYCWLYRLWTCTATTDLSTEASLNTRQKRHTVHTCMYVRRTFPKHWLKIPEIFALPWVLLHFSQASLMSLNMNGLRAWDICQILFICKNKIMTFASKQIKWEIVILSEIRRLKKISRKEETWREADDVGKEGNQADRGSWQREDWPEQYDGWMKMLQWNASVWMLTKKEKRNPT